MNGNVVPLRGQPGHFQLAAQHRIDSVLAMLHAIELGELLAALPTCEFAQSQHRTAVALLAVAERELSSLRMELGDLSDASAT